MKSKISYDEYLYYEYYKKIIKSQEYKEESQKDGFNSVEYFNNKFNILIDDYKLESGYFDDAKDFCQKCIADDYYRNLDKTEITPIITHEKYESSIVSLCIGFFEKKKEYFEPSLYDNYGNLIDVCVSESNIHVYLPLLKPSVFLNLFQYDNKPVIEHELLAAKCNAIFVGFDESNERINYSDYVFLQKYNFISPSNITKESFNVAIGLERLSDDGIMIYNTHALNMYKNDSKSVLFRKYLIENNLLKAVIFTKSFTRKVDYEVTYIITKEKNEKVVFIDAGSNDYRSFYEINPYSEDYDFGDDFRNISTIVNKYIESYGVSSVICYDNIVNNEYRFNLDEYIITEKSKKFRSLEEIQMDIRIIYEQMEDNLY